MTANAPIERLVVFGVGLIGGSFALALKAGGRVRRVVGVGRSRATLVTALDRAIIDEAATDATAVRGADFVLVATPVGQMPAVFAAIAPHLDPGAVVTDGGSTKRDVVAAARAAFGSRFSQFVPGHPIAGAENSGAAAATQQPIAGGAKFPLAKRCCRRADTGLGATLALLGAMAAHPSKNCR